MRLLKLKGDGGVSITKFRTNNVPAYAILSHTWGKDTDEVDYSDLVNGTHIRKAGYKKILFCGKQAERDGLLYFWVDSCCIDKTNNTELSEAIHSMFRWYQKAIKCYVYLIDVPARSKTPDWKAEFSQSRWFTRGWTLQELLAPRQVDFFSYDNQKLGSKRELEQHIHRITGIPTEALRGGHLSKFPVETRLSWAQNRNTTEEEDQAYCLLGIFDVSMPMIYGEGAKAWRRLLYEIGKLPDSGVGREPEMSIKEESEEGDSKGSKKCEEKDDREEFQERRHFIFPHLLRPARTCKSWLLYICITLSFTLLFAHRWNPAYGVMGETAMRSTPVLDRTLPIFAIIGRTGAGKSTFINTLGGLDSGSSPPAVSDGLEPCTNNFTFYKFNIYDKQAYIIDTPGFGDANKSDTQTMAELFNELNGLSLEDRKIRLIYLYDMTIPRFDDEAHKNLAYFEALCGLDNAASVALVTSKWREDPTEEDSRKQMLREKGLKEKYWKTMLEVGAKYETHDGSHQSALLIVQRLLQKPVMLKRKPGWVREKLKEAEEKKAKSTEEAVESEPEEPKSQMHVTWKNPRTLLYWKIMWTTLRVLFLAFVGLITYLVTYEEKNNFPVWFPFIAWVSTFSLATGLLYRWPYISHIALLSLVLFLVLIVFGPGDFSTSEARMFWLGCASALAFSAELYFHWPHNASMYFW